MAFSLCRSVSGRRGIAFEGGYATVKDPRLPINTRHRSTKTGFLCQWRFWTSKGRIRTAIERLVTLFLQEHEIRSSAWVFLRFFAFPGSNVLFFVRDGVNTERTIIQPPVVSTSSPFAVCRLPPPYFWVEMKNGITFKRFEIMA